MASQSHDAIGASDIAVIVEMGDEFTPGPRTAAALAELVDALYDEHGPETSGYQFEALGAVRNFAFVLGDGSVRYNTSNAWPLKVAGPALGVTGNEIAMEEL
jgi:hypothetical protein